MPMTNIGANTMIQMACMKDHQGNAFNQVWIGNGSTPFDKTSRTMMGSSKLKKPCDSGFPTRADSKVSFQATFGANDANWTWNEWGIGWSVSGNNDVLNRVVKNLGTKLQGQTWVMKCSITLQA